MSKASRLLAMFNAFTLALNLTVVLEKVGHGESVPTVNTLLVGALGVVVLVDVLRTLAEDKS